MVGGGSVTPGNCRGCGEPVLVACERGREVIRDVEPLGVLPDGVHLCADPQQRERVALSVANLRFRCPDCGAGYCSPSSWGRIVETPSAVWMSLFWQEPHQPHVCVQPSGKQPRANSKQIEAYRVWTDDAR